MSGSILISFYARCQRQKDCIWEYPDFSGMPEAIENQLKDC